MLRKIFGRWISPSQDQAMYLIIERNEDLASYLTIIMGLLGSLTVDGELNKVELPFPILAIALNLAPEDFHNGNIAIDDIPDIIKVRLADLQKRLGLSHLLSSE